jgi:hypothetical protein
MFAYFPQAQFPPCPDCGAPVMEEQAELHGCDRRRFVEYQMLLMRPEIFGFERELAAWLRTPQGRFETYYAARKRLGVAAV